MTQKTLRTSVTFVLIFLLGAALIGSIARADNAPGIAYRTVTIDDVDIFYREAGNPDRPTLLLLHGFPTSSHMFRDLITELADDYHLVAPDYPGYGFSSMPGTGSLAVLATNSSVAGPPASGRPSTAKLPKTRTPPSGSGMLRVEPFSVVPAG